MAITSHRQDVAAPKPYSLSRQLIFSLSMLALALFFVMLGITWAAVNRHAYDTLRKDLTTHARAVISLSEQGGGHIEVDFKEFLLPEYRREVEPYYLQVWLWDGEERRIAEELTRSSSLKDRNLPLPETLSETPQFYPVTLERGREGYVMAMLFTPPVEHIGDEAVQGVIAVASGLEETYRFRRRFLLLSVTPLVVFFSILLVGINLFVRKGFRPLRALAEEVSKLNVDKLDAPLNIDNPPLEVAPLVDRLQALLQRLQRAMENERRFSDDVAHELRTPIAEIRTLCEISLRNAKQPGTAEAYREVLDAAKEMEALAETLLRMARMEAKTEAVNAERHDLSEILGAVLRRHRSKADERGMTLRYAAPGPLPVMADRQKLELVLNNLVGNAITYAPEKSTVTVRPSGTADGTAAIMVSNPAPDLQQADLVRLFERFWQKNAARGQKGSSGLGLALVKSLCAYMGLTITAHLTDDHELTFAVTGLKAPDDK